MICSIRLDGSTACMTIDGATDTEVFRVYVRGVLARLCGPATWSSWTTSRRTKTSPPWP